MSYALFVAVRLHDTRYHGRPEWPPSPSRLFQALVSGAACGNALGAADRDALHWLERLDPPAIAAPAKRNGKGFTSYVPNNDLDSVGGDPRRVAEIRAGKFIKPFLFDANTTLLYAWTFESEEDHARRLCGIAERLYQLGRGVDMAWAWGEVVDASELEPRLADHRGVVYRPGASEGMVLLCPQKGSLASLERRFAAAGKRFAAVGSGRRTQLVFAQAPKPRFTAVKYGSAPQRLLFDLRRTNAELGLEASPLARAASLVKRVRDLAVAVLKQTRPGQATIAERVFIGRNATEADKTARVRIVPLPSIGSPHVIPAIRRVLVEVPPDCPLSRDDIEGAFSGLEISEEVDAATGEVIETRLVAADDYAMLGHYGIAEGESPGYRVWRSVTPAALPEVAARRRIDPARLRRECAVSRGTATHIQEAKPASERLNEEQRAAAAVVHALRHTGNYGRPATIRVQREPFAGRGARAEDFAPGTRFAKERLWHVEIAFSEPLSGPLLIGDGRYLGLGLMAPDRDVFRDTMAFALPTDTRIAVSDGPALTHAARRALMALAREAVGEVPTLFSGHARDGARAASGRHEHVFLASDDNDGDGRIDRLIVAAPWACDRALKARRVERRTFDGVVSRLRALRAGRLGLIELSEPVELAGRDAVVGPGRVWESRTPYLATRHAGRRKDTETELIHDVKMECARRGLPTPCGVDILSFASVADGGGLQARVRLHFDTAVHGPVLLGRDSHYGGGLFSIPR